MDLYQIGKGVRRVVLLHFPDETLSAVVASRTALESVVGEASVSVMLCVSLLMQVRRLADLMGFTFLQILPVPGNRDLLVEVLHNGVGLQIHPIDDFGRPATEWLDSDSGRQRVAVTALVGARLRMRAAA